MIRSLRVMWVLGLLGISPVQAHLLAPALLQLEETAPAEFSVLWRASALGAQGRQAQPQLPPQCMPLDAMQTAVEPGAALTTRWRVRCDGGIQGQPLSASGLDGSGINVIVRVQFLSQLKASALLDAAHPQWIVTAPDSGRVAVLRDYFKLGVTHLWTGLDHLLFLLGLLLLVRGGRRLLLTVTAFTAGHSVTLSLATLDLIAVPQSLAELMIALTLVVLAGELTRLKSPKPSLLVRKSWAMALLFGLVHGLGFAGALAEIGLPQREIPLSLLAFNLGIETGQLMLMALVLPVAGLWRRHVRVTGGRWTRLLPPYVIGSLAAFWCFERAALLLG